MQFNLEKESNNDLQHLSGIQRLPGELRNPDYDSENAAYLDRQINFESNARSYPRSLPFALAQAKGIYLKDVDGNVYYDCLSGAGALALGHNHDVVKDAIKKIINDNVPMQTLDISTPIKDQFVKDIFSCLPDEFVKSSKILFCGPTGADAVESAIKLVKIATGRQSIVAFHGGYHGMTNAALSITGNLSSKMPIPGLMSEVHFFPFPYQYRNPMGDFDDINGDACINYIEHLFRDDNSGVTKPAGIIIEAIQGEGGIIPAPMAFLQRLKKLTKEQKIPLIIDEVQTGLGRTGKMFAFEHAGIVPDVIVMSKAIGGSQPLAVIVYNKDLDKWSPGAHAGTFRGNQLAMATGSATIRYVNDNLLDHVVEMGNLFKENLKKIQANTNCIGDIRGKGLMLGVEIVNWVSGITQSGNPERFEKLSRLILTECFKRGLIIEIGGRQSSVLRFMPPLIVKQSQVDHICKIFKDAVVAAESMILV